MFRLLEPSPLPVLMAAGDIVELPDGGAVQFVKEDGSGRIRAMITGPRFRIIRNRVGATPPPRGTHRR